MSGRGGRNELGSLPPSAPRSRAAEAAKARGLVRPPVARGVAEVAKAPRPLRLPLHVLADSYLAIAAFALVDTLAIGLLELRQFTGPFELGYALRGLGTLGLVVALPCAFVAGPVVAIVARPRVRAFAASRPGAWVGCTWAAALVVEIVGGRFATGFVTRVVVAALALVLASAGALAWGAVDHLADAGGMFGVRLLSPRLLRAGAALALFAIGAAASPEQARRLARVDNVRFVYGAKSSVLARVVAVADRLAPTAVAAAAPAEATRPTAIDFRGRDVVLITVEALRADHVGAYGYKRPTTPEIDALAAGGALFEAAYTPTPQTSYAIASLMTGKYARALALQGLGAEGDTWATQLRRYQYKTAAFYPATVFTVDAERFARQREAGFDFEVRREGAASGKGRALEVARFLDHLVPEDRAFVWVHVDEPREPYDGHTDHDFGEREIDRYDGEVAAADDGVRAIVDEVRRRRPEAIVVVTSDHGEAFGEHGARNHGTSVFDEQVRVPLIVNAPGLVAPRRVRAPVQTIDLLPTFLAALAVPRPARVRGADLGPFLAGQAPDADPGFAFAESDTQTLVAKSSERLVCSRVLGCALYDVSSDPDERVDVAPGRPADVGALRAELRALEASHAKYEKPAEEADGKAWPDALRRGLAGDGDAAEEIATLLGDADVVVRRKAAEALFALRRQEAAPGLRKAMTHDEDDEVKRWAALALTRLGDGAPRTRDLLKDPDILWRRRAALALAETGDDKGEETLVAWWRRAFPADKRDKTPRVPIPFEEAREIAAALGKLKSKNAVPSLLASLEDVRLRPYVARALAAIGEEVARPSLAAKLRTERHAATRVELARALVKLKGGPELRDPLVHWLGVPDPMPDGIAIAMQAKIIDLIGGPRERELRRLKSFAKSGVAVGLVVPPGKGGRGVRVLCRARTTDAAAGEIHFGRRGGPAPTKSDHDSLVPRKAPDLDPTSAVTLTIPAGDPIEAFAAMPAGAKIKPGSYGDFVIYATQNVEVAACVLVPLVDEATAER